MVNTKEDYKETELGLLPKSWEITKLGNAVNLVMGQSPPGNTYNSEGIGMSFLQGKAEFGMLYPANIKYTSKPLKVAKKGTVLLSVRAPVGDTNIADKDYCIGRGLSSLSLENGDNVFLFYLLTHLKSYIEREGIGSTFKSISKSNLKNIILPIPPLTEQQKIAYALHTVYQAQEKTERVINSLKELKKATMKHLFTYGVVELEEVKRVKLKETEIGKVPYSWLDSRIKDHSKITTGGTPKTSISEYYFPQEIPWMKSGEIQGNKITKINTYISKKGLENSNARILPKGSVVIALAGRGKTRATTAILELECACNQSVVCMIPRENISAYYLHYYLSNLYSYIRNLTGDKDRTGLNMEIVGKIPLFLPTFTEQKQIAEILSSVDTKIQVEESKKIALEQLFKSLLSNLMSAKIRVNNLKIVS